MSQELAQFNFEQGCSYLEAKAFHDALACFDLVIELAPSRAVGYQARAKAAWELGRRADAFRDIDQAVRLGSNNPLLYAERADYHFQQRAFEQAIADCDMVLSLDPGWAPIQGLRGECHAASGNSIAALQDLTAALEADPAHTVQYRSVRAKLLLDCEEWEQCCRECEAIHLIEPTHFYAHQWHGLAQRELGDLETAETDLSEALRHRPESTMTRLARALVYQAKGQYQAAIEDCQILLESQPENRHAQLLMQACLLELNLEQGSR